jgi:peroxiredoxin
MDFTRLKGRFPWAKTGGSGTSIQPSTMEAGMKGKTIFPLLSAFSACSILFLIGFVLSAAYADEDAKPVPRIDGRDINGKRVVADSLYAKGPVIISFWATWCVPCMAESKAIKKLYYAYKDRGLTVVAISVDEPNEIAKVRQFVAANKWPFVVMIDRNKELRNLFQAKEVPATYLIDTAGTIRASHAGYTPGDEKMLEKELLLLLP